MLACFPFCLFMVLQACITLGIRAKLVCIGGEKISFNNRIPTDVFADVQVE